MKKTYLKSFCARCLTLLVLALLSTNLAWGADKTVTFKASDLGGTANSYELKTGTSSGINFSSYSYSKSDPFQFNGSKGKNIFYNTTAMPGAIKSIKATKASGTDRSVNAYVSKSAIDASNYTNAISLGAITVTDKGSTWTLTAEQIAEGYTYFYLNYGTSGALYVSQFDVTYEEPSSKAKQTLSFGTTTEFDISIGDPFTPPTLTGAMTEVTYTSNNSDVVSVNASTGVVTIKGDGTAVITATAAEDDNYKEGSASYTINVVDPDKTTLDFAKIEGFSDWGSSYSEHVVNYTEATVTFASACKQGSTITDIPVTKGNDVSIVANGNATIESVRFNCTQWSDKIQTITLHYSTDKGTSYTSTGITSSNFVISSSSLPKGTNAVKITFSSSSNQVGIESASLKFAAGEVVKLETPTNLVSSNVLMNGATLSWDAVDNASSYTLKFKAGEGEYTTVDEISTNSYTLEGLTGGTAYSWNVQAVGDGTYFSNSDVSADEDFTTSSRELYMITAKSDTHGTFTVQNEDNEDITVAGEGDIVKLSASAQYNESGHYKFCSWTVYKTDDKTTIVEVSDNQFTMPAYGVTIEATFKTLYPVVITSNDDVYTINLKDESGNPVDENSEFITGSKIYLSYEMKEGHKFGEWDIYTIKRDGTKNGDVSILGDEDNPYVEMGAYGLKFSIIEKFTVTYYVIGEQISSEDILEGQVLDLPTPTELSGYAFMGWSPSATVNSDGSGIAYAKDGSAINSDMNYYAVFAKKSVNGEPTYTKLSSNSFDENAKYVLVAEESSSVSTLHYFSSYESTTANESWGVTSTDAADAIIFTLSGEATALVAQDASGNYLTALSTNRFRMSSTSTTLNLHSDGTIYNPTSGSTGYNLRYNHNNGSGGFRWYNGTTGTAAYFYKYEDGITYSDYTTTPSYTRTVTAGNYGTLCLPCAFDIPETMTVYEVSSVEGSSVKLSEVEETVAGTPYLFKSTEANLSVAYKGEAVAEPVENAYLVGNFAETTVPDDGYCYILSSNKFYLVNNDFTSGEYRAYLLLPASSEAKIMDISIEGEINGISETKVNNQPKAVYNLNGVKVNKNYNGIVVINGKKYLNK